MLTLIYNANLILEDAIRHGFVVVENEKIRQVGFDDQYPQLPYDRKVDLQGKYLAPGFVELHTHGAGGADFTDCTVDVFGLPA